MRPNWAYIKLHSNTGWAVIEIINFSGETRGNIPSKPYQKPSLFRSLWKIILVWSSCRNLKLVVEVFWTLLSCLWGRVSHLLARRQAMTPEFSISAKVLSIEIARDKQRRPRRCGRRHWGGGGNGGGGIWRPGEAKGRMMFTLTLVLAISTALFNCEKTGVDNFGRDVLINKR